LKNQGGTSNAPQSSSSAPEPPRPSQPQLTSPRQSAKGQPDNQTRQDNVSPRASQGGSSGKSKKSGGSKAWIFILLIVLIGGAAGGYFYTQNKDSDDDNNSVANEEQEENLERVEVKLTIAEKNKSFFISGSVIEGNSESSLNLEDISKLYRVSDLRKFNFDDQSGQVYFCEEMEGTVVFGVDLKDKKVDELSSDAVELSLFGRSAPAEANCVYRLEDDKIDVNFTKDCMMLIKINDDHKFNSILVSVSGVEGPFKDKFKWDVSAKSNEELDVWVKQDDLDPVAYTQNGKQQVPLCISGSPKAEDGKPAGGVDIPKMIEDITKAAASFGLNPRDRASASQLQQLSMSLTKQPVFVIDGESISGYSVGTNKIKTNFRNDGTTYILVGVPEIVDNQYFKLTYKSK